MTKKKGFAELTPGPLWEPFHCEVLSFDSIVNWWHILFVLITFRSLWASLTTWGDELSTPASTLVMTMTLEAERQFDRRLRLKFGHLESELTRWRVLMRQLTLLCVVKSFRQLAILSTYKGSVFFEGTWSMLGQRSRTSLVIQGEPKVNACLSYVNLVF